MFKQIWIAAVFVCVFHGVANADVTVEPFSLEGTFSSLTKDPRVREPIKVRRILPMTDASSVILRACCQVNGDTAATNELKAEIKIHQWPNGKVLWKGEVPFCPADTNRPALRDISCKIKDLKPLLWEPSSPNLYMLTLTVSDPKSGAKTTSEVRIGFRSFEMKDGVFQFNGKPLFLRGEGNSQYAPPRANTDKKFAEEYVRFMKSKNINMIRVSSRTLLDACDELGMLVLTGHYRMHLTSVEDYRERILANLASHPSVLIYILSNEVRLRGNNKELLLDRYERLKQWDPTRLYIGSCGFGAGFGGEIWSRHPYNGWYNAGEFTSRLRNQKYGPTNQPIVYTECVGAYTTEAGTFQIHGKHLGAALAWVGHGLAKPEHALWYQAFLTKRVAEGMRWGRTFRHNLGGLTPATPIFFQNRRRDMTSFDQMRPNPTAHALGLAYQPILLSLKNLAPHFYCGQEVDFPLYMVNDNDDFSDLPPGQLRIVISDPTKRKLAEIETAAMPYYEAKSVPVRFRVPSSLEPGHYRISASLNVKGRQVSENSEPAFIAPRSWVLQRPDPKRPVWLYDTNGATRTALQNSGIQVKDYDPTNSVLQPESLLVIGKDSWDDIISAHRQSLRDFVKKGGRVLLLLQPPKRYQFDWLPVKPGLAKRGYRGGAHMNPQQPDSPVFDGLSRKLLRMVPARTSFRLNAKDLEHTAILVNFRRGLVENALLEIFEGKGSVLLSGLILVDRAGSDPVTDRFLANLVAYGASAEPHYRGPMIKEPIQWGNFDTERGVAVGAYNGLLLDIENVVNHLPNLPLRASYPVPRGRRPFGPFGYNKMCRVVDYNPKSPTGRGLINLRIPTGKTTMVTEVRNTDRREPRQISFTINSETESSHDIPPGQTIACRTPVPDGATELKIEIVGSKRLVMLSTEFREKIEPELDPTN